MPHLCLAFKMGSRAGTQVLILHGKHFADSHLLSPGCSLDFLVFEVLVYCMKKEEPSGCSYVKMGSMLSLPTRSNGG